MAFAESFIQCTDLTENYKLGKNEKPGTLSSKGFWGGARECGGRLCGQEDVMERKAKPPSSEEASKPLAETPP